MSVRVNSSAFVLPLLKLGQGLTGTSRTVARGIYAKVSDIVPDMVVLSPLLMVVSNYSYSNKSWTWF